MAVYLPSTPRYLKVPLIILNVILWLLGLVLVIIGGIGVGFFSQFKEFREAAGVTDAIKSISVSVPAGVLSIGIFFMILTIAGCIVAYKEKMVGLVFYTVLMLVLLVVLIGIGGEALTYHNDDIEIEIKKNWIRISNSNESDEINKLESYFQCCCYDEEDYLLGHATICPKDINQVNLYNGTYCSDVIYTAINSKLYLVGSAGVAIGVIELVSLMFALFLIIRLYKTNAYK
ncbi:hypothetical protein RB653_006882 [Dictyostelium firmibasis]|uniref:Tetraspanin n=1 Tax=Dictyostelium firmibasis TaxID=79012 RepID=A0AAN7U2W5_9MYCE